MMQVETCNCIDPETRLYTGFFFARDDKTMSNSDFQQLSERLAKFAAERDWDKFHAPKNLVMALSVEAAELTEHFQWLTEEQSHQLDDKKREEVAFEMADIYIYLVRLATKLDIDLPTYVDAKIVNNEQRYPVDKVKGSAKKYNEY